MPNILFASNNIAHWPLSNSTTQAGTFDATRVPYAIRLAHEEVINSPAFIPTTGEISWVHFRMFFNGKLNAGIVPLVKGFAVNGEILFEVRKTFNDSEFTHDITLYRDGGELEGTTSFPININQMNSIDVRYEVTATEINMKLYTNSGLAASLTYAGTHTWGQLAYFTLGASYADVSEFMQVSEIMVADGDTRNARLNLLRPTATGGESDWVGLATALSDDDPSSGMTSIAAEERQTLTLSAYTGADNISALVIATQSVAGANGPQNLRHTVRMSTVNYDGPDDLPLGDILGYAITDFQINPATSLPWVGSDMATLEMGFISKA